MLTQQLVVSNVFGEVSIVIPRLREILGCCSKIKADLNDVLLAYTGIEIIYRISKNQNSKKRSYMSGFFFDIVNVTAHVHQPVGNSCLARTHVTDDHHTHMSFFFTHCLLQHTYNNVCVSEKCCLNKSDSFFECIVYITFAYVSTVLHQPYARSV